eukprot:11794141-Alexandrium_andersonii.AAC.1
MPKTRGLCDPTTREPSSWILNGSGNHVCTTTRGVADSALSDHGTQALAILWAAAPGPLDPTAP